MNLSPEKRKVFVDVIQLFEAGNRNQKDELQMMLEEAMLRIGSVDKIEICPCCGRELGADLG